MCRTYNTIGSLTTLKSSLERNNIYDFKSLKEVITFQKTYSTLKKQLISHHENLIEQEKETLNVNLPILKVAVETQRQQVVQSLIGEIDMLKKQLNISKSCTSKNFIQKLASNLKDWNYKIKIKRKENSFETEVEMLTCKLLDEYKIKSNRFQFLTSHFYEAVRQSAQHPLSELERKKTIIDKLNNYIYGALGEQKVVKILESLSDEFFLINDFDVSFSPAIYNRQENDYIKSVQIDHILVAPSGIFLIETKNWSEKSLENLSLRSPVEQVKRASFVLFYLLNNEKSNYQFRLDKHHWGTKKVSIKNLIVLTKTKPNQEFQYVKILNTDELLSYVNYFKPIFSNDETKKIAEMILMMNELKNRNLTAYKSGFMK